MTLNLFRIAKTCEKRKDVLPWWKVDLKTGGAKLSEVCVYNRKDTEADSTQLNGSSLDILDSSDQSLFSTTLKFEGNDWRQCFTNNVSGIVGAKTIKITRQKVNRKPLEIAEVEVFGQYRVTKAPSSSPSTSFRPTLGEFSELYDLAPLGKVELSCQFKEHTGKRAIDGSMNTFVHVDTYS
jgi:hypothetical protein